MIKLLPSVIKRVRLFIFFHYWHNYATMYTDNFYSCIPRLHKIVFRLPPQHPPLPQHQRAEALSPILLCAASHVLDPPGLGPILRRMDTEFPESASGEREPADVEYSVRERD